MKRHCFGQPRMSPLVAECGQSRPHPAHEFERQPEWLRRASEKKNGLARDLTGGPAL